MSTSLRTVSGTEPGARRQATRGCRRVRGAGPARPSAVGPARAVGPGGRSRRRRGRSQSVAGFERPQGRHRIRQEHAKDSLKSTSHLTARPGPMTSSFAARSSTMRWPPRSKAKADFASSSRRIASEFDTLRDSAKNQYNRARGEAAGQLEAGKRTGGHRPYPGVTALERRGQGLRRLP